MRGFRQQAEGSRKERLKSLEAELKNSQMANRISQMMLQQMMQNMKNMNEDVNRALGLINEMQYKLIAVQKMSNLDPQQLTDATNTLRLKDFNEASAREDQQEGYAEGTVVDEKSTVILTSKTENTDRGIFRSRLKLSECGVPDLVKAFMGREVGARAIIKLNGDDHEVELLGIRQPPVVEAVSQTADAPAEALQGQA